MNHQPTEEKLRDILEKLVLTVGRQVTDDYQGVGGIWEGMSIYNVQAINEAMIKLTPLLYKALSHQRKELREKVKACHRNNNDDYKCNICGYEGGECECIGYNKAIDDVISTLKGNHE